MRQNGRTKGFAVKAALLTGILLGSLVLGGCGTVETLLQKSPEDKQTNGDWIGNNQASPGAGTSSGNSITISLYFADKSGKYLVKEERSIPKTLSLGREAVTQWLKGPAVVDSSIQPAVSPDTTLLDIGIKDGVATVDLSQEFLGPYGKVSSVVTLYGLVDTLAQFPTVQEVNLRVEGKPIKKFDELDTTHLVFNGELVIGSVSGSDQSVPAVSQKGSTSTGNIGSAGSPSAGVWPDSPSAINLFEYPPSSI